MVGNWQAEESSFPRVLQGRHKTKWHSLVRTKPETREGVPQRCLSLWVVGSGAELQTGGRLQRAVQKLRPKSPVTCLDRDPILPCHVISCSFKREPCYVRGWGGLHINKSLSSCQQCDVHLWFNQLNSELRDWGQEAKSVMKGKTGEDRISGAWLACGRQ